MDDLKQAINDKIQNGNEMTYRLLSLKETAERTTMPQEETTK